MQMTINSRTLGEKITFSRPGSSYVFVDLPGKSRQQICKSGKLLGSTIEYSGDNVAEFKKICRAWLAAYAAKQFA
jgi:hypothetical protein